MSVTDWSVTLGVVEVGVVDTCLAAAALSGTGARVYTPHMGWLQGVVTGISAASTGGVLVTNCEGECQ